MTTTYSTVTDAEIVNAVRYELLQLALQQDELAASEAARVPYWAPSPASVEGHRAAALALRADADRFSIF